jgi:YceI-like protein
MRRALSICLLAIVPLSTQSLAAPEVNAAATGAVIVNSAKLSIDGTSTMHDYSLSTTRLTVDSLVADATSLLQPGALQALEVQIPLNGFASEKDGLIKKFLETMKADKHPVIVFKLVDYAVDGATVRPKGTLTVAGVTRDIDLELNVSEAAGVIHVRGTRTLSMKDFGIKAPTMFMGMLKTNDQVTIKFELALSLASKASN